MSKRTALLSRTEVNRAIDDLADTAVLFAWDTGPGRAYRLLIDIAHAYLATLPEPKLKKPKAKPKKPKPKAKRRTSR